MRNLYPEATPDRLGTDTLFHGSAPSVTTLGPGVNGGVPMQCVVSGPDRGDGSGGLQVAGRASRRGDPGRQNRTAFISTALRDFLQWEY